MSKHTHIVTSTTTLFKAADAIAALCAPGQGPSKKQILDALAAEITGPDHDWGFLTGSDTAVVEENLDLASAGLQSLPFAQNVFEAARNAMVDLIICQPALPAQARSRATISRAITPYVIKALDYLDALAFDLNPLTIDVDIKLVPGIWSSAMAKIWGVDQRAIYVNRKDLISRPAWEDVGLTDDDDDANPIVWRNHYHDRDGKRWEMDWSGEVEDDGHSPYQVDWIGPQDPAERALYDALPDAGEYLLSGYVKHSIDTMSFFDVMAPRGMSEDEVVTSFAPRRIAQQILNGCHDFTIATP